MTCLMPTSASKGLSCAGLTSSLFSRARVVLQEYPITCISLDLESALWTARLDVGLKSALRAIFPLTESYCKRRWKLIAKKDQATDRRCHLALELAQGLECFEASVAISNYMQFAADRSVICTGIQGFDICSSTMLTSTVVHSMEAYGRVSTGLAVDC